ncbi:MAG: response regulator transcription factor [Firmicutes bacterium]|nr:response regulator transcription factor [Bacillota bacterium]
MLQDTRIMVVEDERITSDVIKAYLEREGAEVVLASSGISALPVFREINPDLVILDLMLPGMSGEEICKAIRSESKVPILMLTAKAEEHQQVLGLSIGADDYVLKPFSPKVLQARIFSLLRRARTERPLDENTISLDHGSLILMVDKHEVKRFGKNVNLKPAEFKLLNILAQNRGRVFERSHLAVKMHGFDYEGFDRTIDVHIRRLRQKLEKDPENPVLIKTVFGVGYKLESD